MCLVSRFDCTSFEISRDKVSGQKRNEISLVLFVIFVIVIVVICEFINLCKLYRCQAGTDHRILGNVFNEIIFPAFSHVLLSPCG